MKTLEPHGGVIEDGVHLLSLRVYYEDTDAGGIVYHGTFVRFFERGRSEMLRALGIDHAAAWMRSRAGRRVGFAVRRMEVDFLAPARLDDALVVHSAVTRLAAAHVDARQWIDRGRTRVAEARFRVVLVDETGRPVRLPADWRCRLAGVVEQE